MSTAFASPYQTETWRIDALSQATVAAMADLYLNWYDGSSAGLFRSDLAEKDEAILLRHQGKLAGFTTLKTWETRWRGQSARIIYSGDTIVDRPHWGQQALSFAWIARAGKLKRAAPKLPLYWFLLVKGHRTFRYLSVFSQSFFPHWRNPRPDLQEFAEHLARARFGDSYDATTGIVRFPASRGHMKTEIAEAKPEELAKPAIRFFLQRNPGYRQGDELVCLCELESANLKPLAARIFNAE